MCPSASTKHIETVIPIPQHSFDSLPLYQAATPKIRRLPLAYRVRVPAPQFCYCPFREWNSCIFWSPVHLTCWHERPRDCLENSRWRTEPSDT